MKLDVVVREDARSQISTTLLAAREKGRFAQSRRAFFGKRQGSSFADAGGASGDEDGLVFEGFHSWPQRSEDRFFG